MQESHSPTEATRAQVEALAGYGIIHEEIASYLCIDPKTLRKYYRKELDNAVIRANVAVARRLHQHATSDSVAAAIFWMKARAGWRETQVIAGDADNPLMVVHEVRTTLVDPKDHS